MILKKRFKYDQEKNELLKTVREFLKIEADDLEIYHIYIFKNSVDTKVLQKELFDDRYMEVVDFLPQDVFFVKDNDGQYNQVEDLTTKYINDILGIEEEVRYVKGFSFKNVGSDDLKKIKSYLINPVVQKEIKLEDVTFDYEISEDTEMLEVEGFIDFDDSKLIAYKENFGFDIDDLKFIQQYFKTEGRNPRYCELKMLDTYWSDHCRHTTFLTELKDINIEEGKYKEEIEKTYNSYLDLRQKVYGENKKPVTLMDVVTLKMRELKKNGSLSDMEDTSEVNACSIEVDIDFNGKTEKWLHIFKNETHNHPTEIEPYGGAHTCIGGGIRDPLSARSTILQGIRIVGAGNPLTKHENTIDGKLPQRYLANTAMNGFSDYANQIGSSVGIVREFYDDGFQAKRMELGALVAAAPRTSVVRKEPKKGDLILLLGAPTGRDGLGAAIGSSSMQTEKSLTKAGAEVQKGNPYAERRIMRLFQRSDAAKLIKKCNDFGAGGVSVAIGELAPGLDIFLDEVYTKYPGLNGYEIALSESQERMAVVIEEKDLKEFSNYLQEEDVRYSIVAKVTDNDRLQMYSKGKIVIDLSRELLDSNGASKEMKVEVETNPKDIKSSDEITKLNQSITRNISQNFDSTLGRNRIFMEYGGKFELTQQDAIVTKFPLEDTNAVSVMAYGYYPEIGKKSPYHAGYYGVLQSITKNIAITGKYEDIRLTMQEFFPSIKSNPKRMGIPFAALLGTFEVMNKLNIPAIGGKDSMSGTFKDIDVPPTLVSFAVNMSTKDKVVSRELKTVGTKLYITDVLVKENGLICFDSFKKSMKEYGNLLEQGKVLSASAVSEYGLIFTLKDMGLGNNVGFEISNIEDKFMPGTIVFESSEDINIDGIVLIGKTVENNDFEKNVEERTSLLKNVFEDIVQREDRKLSEFTNISKEELKLSNKKVLIPVVDGSTGEYDLQKSFEKVGFEVEQFVIKTINHKSYLESVEEFAGKLAEVGILAIPHGDYFGSVIKNISGFIVKILEDEKVKKSLKKLLERKGFIIGFGAGMSVLIDAGLFGEIKNNLMFVPNKNNKYVSTNIVCKNISESYISDCEEKYSSIISGKNITLKCENIEELKRKVNIISMFTEVILPNDCGIDAMSSKCGHIIGVRSLIDRMSEDLYKNINIVKLPRHFDVLRKNFE